MEASTNLCVVGAYPFGQYYDMCYGKSDERPLADIKISSVLLPILDPVYGSKGPLVEYWLELAIG